VNADQKAGASIGREEPKRKAEHRLGIRRREQALAIADELEEGNTGFLMERALDEARSQQFRPVQSS
jgi:hypothetical protein